MAKYIPLDAVLAWAKKTYLCKNASAIRKVCYKQLLEHLDTLEVKEVNLDKELESFAYTLPHSAIGDGEHLGKFDDPKVKEARKHGWSHLWRYNYVKEIAKHFFELGLMASNPLTWEDIKEICVQSVLVEIDLGGKVSDERHYSEVLKRFKAQKGEKL